MQSDWRRVADRLEVRPMSARSLILSTLLGTHPPHLPPQAFVAVAALFDVPAGTVRTALSRLASEGELASNGGRYELGASFGARQHALDAGRRARHEPWDGTWWTAVVLSDRRTLADRRNFRATMARALMGEIRPEVWMRPANLPAPEATAGLFVARGPLGGDESRSLVASLWDLARWRQRLQDLIGECSRAEALLEGGDPATLAESFVVSVAAARALAAEPQLPAELVGPAWPADELRERYDGLERRHGRVLHEYLTSAPALQL